MLVSALITQAFLDLGVIAPGEDITTAEQTDAFTRLNQLLSQLSTEQLSIFNVLHGSFTVTAGTASYTFGLAGTIASAARPVRITGWSSVSGVFRNGGVPVSFAEFESRALNTAGETSVLAKMVAADMGFPNINVKIFPTPAATPGSLELDYWSAITAFSTVGDTVTLPDGFEKALHLLLAVDLFPQYARPGVLEQLGPAAQAAKASIVAKNAEILGMQKVAPAPEQ